MTLASMRANGVRSLWAVCAVCHHEVVLNVDTYNEAVTIPSFGPEMVCTCCGIIRADVRPNWSELPQNATIDGEVVVCDPMGVADFELLHSREHDRRASLYAF